MRSMSRSKLDAFVGEATVDCYDEVEQLTGLFTMIEDNLERVDLVRDEIVALCHRERMRQRIGILDLPLPDPRPDGAEWIEAYRHWAA